MSQTRLPLLLTCLFLLMIGGSSCNHTKSIAYVNEKYANDASQFMELAGLNVHYRDEGAGKPIIMVHGLGGFLQMWDAWAEDFSQDHRVIRMDLPMSGLTGPLPELPDEASIDLFVDFLHGFILKLGVQDFHLVGNSLGGWVAWAYAVKYPDQVDKLVLIDAAGLFEVKDGPMVVKLLRGPFGKIYLKSGVPKWVVAMFYRGAYGDNKQLTKERVTRFYELLNREGNFKAMYDQSNFDIHIDKDQVNTITQPTLILWGEADKWIDVKFGHEFDERIPDSRLLTYPGLGHAPMEEAPLKTAKVTREFLNESTE